MKGRIFHMMNERLRNLAFRQLCDKIYPGTYI